MDESILDIALVKGLYLSRMYYALVFTTHSRIVITPSTMMYEFICSEFKGEYYLSYNLYTEGCI